ncbi:O-antigen ligase family protein [Frigidibacter sp. MR17.24]|uniref:O-antigen ligase family protein n=1 Tax=Frigidibacter sp. MR17.24 TaxID=3127345 RepID=UPI003012CF01
MPEAMRKSRRLHLGIVVYIFGVMVPIGFPTGALQLNVMRLVLLILFAPMLMRLLSGKCGRILPVDILFVLHMVWAAVALGYNNPNLVVANVGSAALEFLGGYLLARVYIRTPEDFLALSKGLALAVGLTLPLALYETVTDRSLVIEFLQRIPGIFTVHEVMGYERRMGLARVQLGFPHPILFGVFSSMVIPLALIALRGAVSNTRRYLTAAAVAICCFTSLSSGALLAIVLQLGLLTWSLMMARFEARWKILVGIFALMYVAIDMASNRAPLQVFMSYATFSPHNAYIRQLIFEWGMVNVWANPWFGIGLNDWVRPGFLGGSADNFWLVMAMRYGFPGVLTLMAGWLWLLWKVMRADLGTNASLNNMRLAWVFSMIALSFSLATVHVWTATYSVVFFFVGSGVWMIGYRPREDDAGQPAEAAPQRRNIFARDLRGTGFARPASAASPVVALATAPAFSRFAVRPAPQPAAPESHDPGATGTLFARPRSSLANDRSPDGPSFRRR